MRTAEAPPDRSHPRLAVNGAVLLPRPDGALFWPARDTLIVADLHLEKGSAYAERGQLLPPYDSAATLTRLEAALRELRPRRVVCLGDSFHDNDAAERLPAPLRERLRGLSAAHDWLWVSGNHDPRPPADLGGTTVDAVSDGGLVLQHAPDGSPPGPGHVLGHFHPKARVRLPQRGITARCFVGDGERLILPAFGAYAGGLDVLDPAISSLLAPRFTATLLGERGVYAFPRRALVPIA